MIYPDLDLECVEKFEYSMDHESTMIDQRREHFATRTSGTMEKRTNLYRFFSENVITYASIIPPKSQDLQRLRNFYKRILEKVDFFIGDGINDCEITIFHYHYDTEIRLTYLISGNRNIYLQSTELFQREGGIHYRNF